MITNKNIYDENGYILVEAGQDVEETLKEFAKDSNKLVQVLGKHTINDILNNQKVKDAVSDYFIEKYGPEWKEMDLDNDNEIIQKGYYADDNDEGYTSVIPDLSGMSYSEWEGSDASDEHLRTALFDDNIEPGLLCGNYYITEVLLPKKGTRYGTHHDGSKYPLETVSVKVDSPYDKIEKLYEKL